MKRIVAILLLAAPLCASAGVYKCSKGGKTQYQDTPCAAGAASSEVKIQPGTAEPADGVSDAGDTSAPSELDRTKAWLKSAQDDREKASLDHQIRNAQIDRDQLQTQMDNELAALQVKKLYAKNNLAGATWEQSISTEMAAVTQKYDAKMRAAENHIADLKAQRAKYEP